MIKKTIQFIKDVRLELTKVAWPNRQELTGSTTMVIIFSILSAVFIGVTDFVLSQMAQFILR